ncbi:MAG TPA: type VI secretion system baseplate subunit TssE [Syntrophales bacterium]|jgi:type VI secretion system protein|nr:type VI secretion system baseplate subunit TssE [Syntrophales bacterium]HON22240.1 type VI secretion system baseplate subunit TssE [Syntrophales bacterium]HOU77268.1 type VI secretion system baseplate subunit TssE [Syntrophales bacterium]HPC32699.1 type VI secretion system baseplate subunit TssE [Syntrophales bacterium]HQG34240.1 type VI secretion system baseplate subunit TssE [Syntrophales bacterium]
MYEETLLERIRHLERDPQARGARDISLGINSVLNHLQKMMNTRQGSVPIAEDYGMPDLTNFPGDNLGAAAAELEHMIKTVIQKYEPRLIHVDVHFDPKPGETSILRFRLEGAIMADRDKTTPIVFETIVTAEGAVHIEK